MGIDDQIQEAGARADSVSPFVFELLRSLEARIVALEPKPAPKQEDAPAPADPQQ